MLIGLNDDNEEGFGNFLKIERTFGANTVIRIRTIAAQILFTAFVRSPVFFA